MTTTISNLPKDLVVEILSRVPITYLGSVRATCKQWNALSRNQIIVIAEAKNQFLGFMIKGSRVCSVRIDLQEIRKVGLSIKQVSVLNQIEVYKIYHYDGLLLLCTSANTSAYTSRLLVWNPYLGQMRWIPHLFDSCDSFILGHDNSGNRKIFQLLNFYHEHVFGFKIYEFSSNSWRNLDVTPHCKIATPDCKIATDPVTLKGNAYFYVQEEIIAEGEVKMEHFLLCFDFTSERFGSPLSLMFHYSFGDTLALSCVRDEKLAMLYEPSTRCGIREIWITNKIDYNEVLWSKLMEVDLNLLTGFPYHTFLENFFVDEENKVAVVFDIGRRIQRYRKGKRIPYQKAHIIGLDGYFKSIDVGGALWQFKDDLVLLSTLCSSYVPSLVQIS